MSDREEEKRKPALGKPNESDLKWLNREDPGELATIELPEFFVPRKLFRRVLLRTFLMGLMVWPIVPYAVVAVMSPMQKKATIEQLSPDPEERTSQTVLTVFEPFTVILIAELLTLGIWAFLVVPDFIKVYEFNKKYK